jgi:hypothetical protein
VGWIVISTAKILMGYEEFCVDRMKKKIFKDGKKLQKSK